MALIGSGLLAGAGGGGLTVEVKTASFTAEASKKYKVDSTLAPVVVTLPAGTDVDNIIIQDVGHAAATNNITINPDGAETIDNDTTFVIDQNEGDVDIGYNDVDSNWEVSSDGSPNIVYGPGDLVRKVITIEPVARGWQSTEDPTYSTTPSISIQGGYLPYLAFNAGSPNIKGSIPFTMPLDWDGDLSAVTVNLTWSPSNTNTGDVMWRIGVNAMATADSFQGAAIWSADAANGDTAIVQITSGGVGGGANAVAGMPMQLFIQRRGSDAGDTFTGVAHVSAISLEYNAIDQLTAASEAAIAAAVVGSQRVTIYASDMHNQTGASVSNINDILPCINLGPSGFEQAHFPIKLPKRYDNGQIRWRVFWAPNSTNTGDCQFYVVSHFIANGEAIVSGGSAVNVFLEAGGGTIDDLQITAWSTFQTLTGDPDDNHLLVGRVQRQGDSAADTYTGEMQVIAVEFEYISNAATDD